MSQRPMPQITAINRPFWEACNRGVLALQRCESSTCKKYVFYPRVCCPHCGNGVLEWMQVSGEGELVSFTKVYRPQHDSFRGEIPIYFIAVRLTEGPLVYSRLVRRPDKDEGLLGCSVRVTFPEFGDTQKLPFFELKE